MIKFSCLSLSADGGILLMMRIMMAMYFSIASSFDMFLSSIRALYLYVSTTCQKLGFSLVVQGPFSTCLKRA